MITDETLFDNILFLNFHQSVDLLHVFSERIHSTYNIHYDALYVKIHKNNCETIKILCYKSFTVVKNCKYLSIEMCFGVKWKNKKHVFQTRTETPKSFVVYGKFKEACLQKVLQKNFHEL